MTDDEGWEQRMSDRANVRRLLEEAARATIRAAQEAEWLEVAEAKAEEEIERRSQEIPLDQAQEILDNPWACGCAGSERPGWPCYCAMTIFACQRAVERATEEA